MGQILLVTALPVKLRNVDSLIGRAIPTQHEAGAFQLVTDHLRHLDLLWDIALHMIKGQHQTFSTNRPL